MMTTSFHQKERKVVNGENYSVCLWPQGWKQKQTRKATDFFIFFLFFMVNKRFSLPGLCQKALWLPEGKALIVWLTRWTLWCSETTYSMEKDLKRTLFTSWVRYNKYGALMVSAPQPPFHSSWSQSQWYRNNSRKHMLCVGAVPLVNYSQVKAESFIIVLFHCWDKCDVLAFVNNVFDTCIMSHNLTNTEHQCIAA